MNKSGLAMLKTLACITAVSFFTLYQSYDSYHYDINLTLNVLSFVSTIATPLYFLLSGYIDAGELHTPAWQLGKIRRILLIFIFWFSFFWFAGMHHKGYLIQPWFVIALIVIYVSHPLIDRLIQRPGLMASGILLLLVLAFAYDLLASLYPDQRALSLLPQYRIWTWVLYYLTGRLMAAPRVMQLLTSPRVIKISLLLLPAVYLFTWLYERHYFLARFLATHNDVVLTGSQVYLLVVLIVISINTIRLPEKVQWLTPFLTTLGKTMTGVYILHYLIFGLLATAIRIQTLGDKLLVIALTLIFSMALSLLLLRIPGVSKLISL
ncbi:acyltransferase family protein [Pantoea agglomerans]|uniref:acyltransferase family protein n=1 Tax=Pantoea TaxID=53335 RepID=UPI00221F6522|nr:MULTISPECIES: acyltransferase family protein [Pantoea]MCW0939268.1 acyltransferase family protein [Pantoea sp. RG18]MDQ0631758.1 surface polysaccharide O-acyltransferase-like enzyme [Pantoea agglomerans]